MGISYREKDTAINLVATDTSSSVIAYFASVSKESQVSPKWVPVASSIRIYSDWTGFSTVAFQSRTFGTGISRMLDAYSTAGKLGVKLSLEQAYAYKVHGRNFGCNCSRYWPRTGVGDPRDDYRAIIHRKSEDFVESAFSELHHRYTSLGANALGCDLLKCRNIESPVALL
jgi:hypothetical protein